MARARNAAGCLERRDGGGARLALEHFAQREVDWDARRVGAVGADGVEAYAYAGAVEADFSEEARFGYLFYYRERGLGYCL